MAAEQAARVQPAPAYERASRGADAPVSSVAPRHADTTLHSDGDGDGDDDDDWRIVAPGAVSTFVLEPGEIAIQAEVHRAPLEAIAAACDRVIAGRKREDDEPAIGRQRPTGHDDGGTDGGKSSPLSSYHRNASNVLRWLAGRHVLVTTPVHASADARMRWCLSLFEGASIRSLFFLPEPVAVCLAVGELEGARVLDLGFSSCRVAYVSRGKVQYFAVHERLGVGAYWDCFASGAVFNGDNGESCVPPAAAAQAYVRALFPSAAGKGLRKLLGKLPERARWLPLIVVGGGVAVAGAAFQTLLMGVLADLERDPDASSSDSSYGDSDSSGESDAAARVKAKVLISPGADERRKLVAFGASLFAAAGVEKVTVLRAQYDALGPRVVLEKCP